MAVQAIHDTDRQLGNISLKLRVAVLGYLAMRIDVAHQWNHLLIFIRGNIFDLLLAVHMPMNSTHRPMLGIASTHVQKQADGKGRIFLIS